MSVRTVFAKETLNESRNIRTYLLRVAYVVLVFALLVVFFRDQIVQLGEQIAEDQDDRMARLAQNLYTFTAFTQLLLVTLLTPVLVTASFQSEKRAGTLELLTISRLRNRDVVLGKVFGKYVQVLTLVLVGVPILTLIKVFGFVELQYVLCALFSSTAMMVIAGAIAAYYGMTAGSLLRAILSTYGLIAVLLISAVVLWALLAIVFHSGTLFGAEPRDWIHYIISPVFAQNNILPRGDAGYSTLEFALLSLGQLLFATLVAWHFLNKAELEFRWWRLGLYSAAAGGSHEAEKTVRERRNMGRRTEGILAESAAPKSVEPPADGAIELQQRVQERTNKLRKLARASLLLSVTIGGAHLLFATSGQLSVHHIFFSLHFLTLTAIATILAGASFAQEQEDQTLAVLLTTPLTTNEILLGKAKSILRYFWAPYLVLALLALFFASIGEIGPWGLLVVLLGMPVFFGLLLTLSLCVSATMARAGRAIAYAVSFLVLLTLGTFMIGSLLITAAGGPGSGWLGEALYTLGDLVRALNPVVLIAEGIEAGYSHESRTAPQLAPRTILLSLIAATCFLCAFVVLLRLRFQTWVRRHV